MTRAGFRQGFYGPGWEDGWQSVEALFEETEGRLGKGMESATPDATKNPRKSSSTPTRCGTECPGG